MSEGKRPVPAAYLRRASVQMRIGRARDSCSLVASRLLMLCRCRGGLLGRGNAEGLDGLHGLVDLLSGRDIGAAAYYGLSFPYHEVRC